MRGESLLQESAKFVHSLVLLERGTTRSGHCRATRRERRRRPLWLLPEVEDRASGRLPELVSPEVVAVPRLALSLGSFPEVES